MTQQSFDPFSFEERANARCNDLGLTGQARLDEARKLMHRFAKAERDHYYRLAKSNPDFKNVSRFTLSNQLEKYQSFGVAGRGYRNVYYIQYDHATGD